jgi:hypothetical protein
MEEMHDPCIMQYSSSCDTIDFAKKGSSATLPRRNTPKTKGNIQNTGTICRSKIPATKKSVPCTSTPKGTPTKLKMSPTRPNTLKVPLKTSILK